MSYLESLLEIKAQIESDFKKNKDEIYNDYLYKINNLNSRFMDIINMLNEKIKIEEMNNMKKQKDAERFRSYLTRLCKHEQEEPTQEILSIQEEPIQEPTQEEPTQEIKCSQEPTQESAKEPTHEHTQEILSIQDSSFTKVANFNSSAVIVKKTPIKIKCDNKFALLNDQSSPYINNEQKQTPNITDIITPSPKIKKVKIKKIKFILNGSIPVYLTMNFISENINKKIEPSSYNKKIILSLQIIYKAILNFIRIKNLKKFVSKVLTFRQNNIRQNNISEKNIISSLIKFGYMSDTQLKNFYGKKIKNFIIYHYERKSKLNSHLTAMFILMKNIRAALENFNIILEAIKHEYVYDKDFKPIIDKTKFINMNWENLTQTVDPINQVIMTLLHKKKIKYSQFRVDNYKTKDIELCVSMLYYHSLFINLTVLYQNYNTELKKYNHTIGLIFKYNIDKIISYDDYNSICDKMKRPEIKYRMNTSAKNIKKFYEKIFYYKFIYLYSRGLLNKYHALVDI